MSDFFFSRGMTTHFGKCTETIKTQLPEQASADFKTLVRECGGNEAAVLRDIVFLQLYGKTFTELSANHGASVLKRRGAESGGNRAELGHQEVDA